MHIHIVGIAGSMTAPLALALQKQGHHLSGSDQEKIYPPFSQQLHKANIPINQTNINHQIDLAIIGSSFKSFKKTRDEYEDIKNKNISYISATNYISQNLIKKNSILVAGSYGKTTISAAISFLLKNSSFNPSYMFGGQSLNKLESIHFSDSDWSVTEADESINGLDTQAKFLYYPVKYLILTSANWEHKESYASAKDNLLAFEKLIKNIPKDGVVIYNPKDSSIQKILKFARCSTIAYQATKLKNNLLGLHNQENLGAVEALANFLHIPQTKINSSFKSFKGIKRRLELVANINNILFIDDFAQSPERISSALQAIKSFYPNSKIKVFYENHASFAQYSSNLKELSSALSTTKEVIIFRLKFNSQINSHDRLCAKDFLKSIPNSMYLPLEKDILNHYKNTLNSGDILIHFSSGGSEGLKILKKIIHLFKGN